MSKIFQMYVQSVQDQIRTLTELVGVLQVIIIEKGIATTEELETLKLRLSSTLEQGLAEKRAEVSVEDLDLYREILELKERGYVLSDDILTQLITLDRTYTKGDPEGTKLVNELLDSALGNNCSYCVDQLAEGRVVGIIAKLNMRELLAVRLATMHGRKVAISTLETLVEKWTKES